MDNEHLCLFYQFNRNPYESSSLSKKQVSQNNGGNYLNSACWCCQFWFSDIATSPPVIFYVSLCGNLKQVVSPALRRPSWRKSLEYINWCRRPFRTVSYYQALASRWKDEIFEFEYIIIDVLSERFKISKTFTERDCSPKFYVTIIKQNGKEINYVYTSIEICVYQPCIHLVHFTLARVEFLNLTFFPTYSLV